MQCFLNNFLKLCLERIGSIIFLKPGLVSLSPVRHCFQLLNQIDDSTQYEIQCPDMWYVLQIMAITNKRINEIWQVKCFSILCKERLGKAKLAAVFGLI
jgi:hypothetical protein